MQEHAPYPDNPQRLVEGYFSPAERYPELFLAAVACTPGDYDGKKLIDSRLVDPETLDEKLAELRSVGPLELETAYTLWSEHFVEPKTYDVDLDVDPDEVVSPVTGMTMDEYITQGWDDLEYHVAQHAGTATELGTENPHFKSGRRYGEGYYWDVSDGLEGMVVEAQGNPALWPKVFGVLNNFRAMINEFGFVPNGMRSYYLTRSQPPKFAHMVMLVARNCPSEYMPVSDIVEEYLPQVVQEYGWWMKGRDQLDAEQGIRAADHVVMMPDGSVLNRFWDVLDTPRPEGYRKDLEAAEGMDVPQARRLYRNLRIIAESGRDFTAEYLDDPTDLSSACADRIVPVDLNSLLWQYEDFIARAHDRAGRSVPAKEFRQYADSRAAAINKYMWVDDPMGGYYSGFKFNDYDYQDGAPTGFLSMTTAYPVARGIAPLDRSEQVCTVMVRDLLKAGGFVASNEDSKQQWDSPNGWAPDQNEGTDALDVTGHRLNQQSPQGEQPGAKWIAWANVARSRWVGRHTRIFKALGKIVEKCNVIDRNPLAVQDGEYPLQDGFLWTNGILRKFMTHLKGVQLPPDCAQHLQRENGLLGAIRQVAQARTA
ncbi:MAG TPA: trehalase family glycosidase [Candidatus Saccharimonadales bacterium]|nr:trehalase family glycosidase [Candidatus Saccharimonadales bacterium]